MNRKRQEKGKLGHVVQIGVYHLTKTWCLTSPLLVQTRTQSPLICSRRGIRKGNRPSARWRHFTTTTRIRFGFLFIFKFGSPSEVNNKSPNLHKKTKPWRILVIVVKWRHHANDLFNARKGACEQIRPACERGRKSDAGRELTKSLPLTTAHTEKRITSLLLVWVPVRGGGGYSWEFLVGVCRLVLEILSLFQTKNVIFHIRFKTWPLKARPVFRPGL